MAFALSVDAAAEYGRTGAVMKVRLYMNEGCIQRASVLMHFL